MKRFIWILLLLPLFLFADKNVLVLHSYHHGLEWTDDISQGVVETFDNSEEKINLYFEYLDAKRNVTPRFLKTTYNYFKVKHKKTNFDLIIASDNNALAFLNEHSQKFFPDKPIVFSGINDYDSTLTNKIKLVTGVKESVEHERTIGLASKLFPKRKYLMVILDETLTGKKLLQEVKRVESTFASRFEFLYYSQLPDKECGEFLNTHRDEIVVYLLTYNRDKAGKFYSYKESIKYLKEKFGDNIPFVGSWSFFLGKGIVGGAITSGKTQGKIASKIALEVLNGKNIQDIPIVSSAQAVKNMGDYFQMKKFELTEEMFPQNTSFINVPESLWRKYKYELIIISILLASILLFMSAVIFFKGKENALLANMNKDLDKKVIHATKQIKKEEQLFRFLADSSQNVIFLMDTNLQLTYANKSFEHYFEILYESFIGSPMHVWLPPEMNEIIDFALKKLKENQQIETSFEYFDDDKECMSRFYVFAHFSEDNKLLGYKVVIDDITEEGRKIAQLTRKSHIDGLTGASNRAYFDEVSVLQFDKHSLLSLLMVDIDFFKKVNDTYGHAVGDEVLKIVAKALKNNLRKQDKVFRIGGEEFAIILPLAEDEAVHIADKIRAYIEQTTFDIEKHSIAITISVGVSTKKEMDKDFMTLFKQADEALYKAKANGRNQVCTFDNHVKIS